MFGPSMGFIHVSSSFIFQYLQVISPSAFCGFRTGLQKYRMVQASFRFSESGNLAFEDCCNILGTLGDVFVVFPGAEPDVLKKASDRSRVTWLDESNQIPLTSSMSIFINLLALCFLMETSQIFTFLFSRFWCTLDLECRIPGDTSLAQCRAVPSEAMVCDRGPEARGSNGFKWVQSLKFKRIFLLWTNHAFNS